MFSEILGVNDQKGNHGMCVNAMGIFTRLLLNYLSDQAEFLSVSTEVFFSLFMFYTPEKMVGLWLVLLTSTASLAAPESKNFLSDPDLKFCNFAKEFDERRLNGSFIKELNVTSEIFCQIECATDSRCLSYNLIPILGMEMFVCQLNHGDRFVGHQNFIDEEGAIYRGIQVSE